MTFARRRFGYLTIALLIGLIGGLGMSAIAGARRTQSSYFAFSKSTNPSDLIVYHNDSEYDTNATDVAFRPTIARLPHVARVESATAPSELVLGADGKPDGDAAHRRFDSLNTLVSRPPLYGWNWNYELLGPYGGFADAPQPRTGHLLDRDPDVAAWTSVSFDDLRIDGKTVPVLGSTTDAKVAPPVLSGHALDATNQVVMGPTTLAALHKRVGGTVELDDGHGKTSELQIVGTATFRRSVSRTTCTSRSGPAR